MFYMYIYFKVSNWPKIGKILWFRVKLNSIPSYFPGSPALGVFASSFTSLVCTGL